MDAKPTSKAAPTIAAAATCALVPDGWADGEPCPMYDVRELGAAGARLVGSLLLELEEEVLLELGFPDGTRVRSRARVVGIDRKDTPGIRVDFVELDEPTRALLSARATPTTP